MTQDPEIEAHRASYKGVPGEYFLASLSLTWKDQTCKSKNMCRIAHERTALGLSNSIQTAFLDQSDFLNLSLSISNLYDRCELRLGENKSGECGLLPTCHSRHKATRPQSDSLSD